MQDFLDNLENEDDDADIFERSDSESEDDEEDSFQNVDIENVDVNIETNVNEIIDQPVDNNTNRTNHCANVN